MNLSTRKLAMVFPAAGVFYGITQVHYLISHLPVLAGAAAAVTGGAWLLMRDGKAKPQTTDDPAIAPQAQAYLEGIRAAGQLPSSQPTWPSQTVQGRITREV